MGNKRLKKREHSLKGLGRRSLSLLMAMVMTLSLVQISAFAEEDVAETPKDPLTPDPISLKDNAKYDNHDITLSKTAQRVGDTEWEVTVKADIGETEIKQQPLEVVFVIDRSGSMNWCAKDEHGQGSHEHEKNYEVLYQGEWYERIGWEHTNFFGGDKHPKTEYENGKFNPTLCPDYKHDPCTKAEVKHGERGSDDLCVPCQYKDSDGKWKDYETRMEATKTAVGNLVSSLPKGTEVTYVSYTTKGWNWNKPDINVSKDLNSLNLTPTGNTNTNEGMEVGIEQFKSNVSKKVLVLLTDGEVSKNYSYTSSNYDTFDGSVYVVGFAFSNDALADVPKNGGTFAYAKNTTDLENSFTELATRISAMIVDPMGNDVTYVSGSVQDKGKTAGTISVDGNTLRWIPKDKEKFSNSTIEYTYRVSLRPQQEAGSVDNIALNNTTYLQYGVTKGEETKKFEAEFPIPKGYYKVSTLNERFVDEDGKDISDYVEQPHTFFQSKVTDNIKMNGDTYLDVNAPAKTLDTNDEHVKYLYVSSTLDKADYAYNVDSDGNYVADSLDVTDKAEAHELVHVYKRATVNSVEYVYNGDVPEDATELTDGYAKTWYPTGTTGIEVQPDAESEKYNFSGWEKISGEAKVETETRNEIDYAVPGSTFTLTAPEGNVPAGDVVFQGKWTLKPSYRVVADYYIITDGGDRVKQNGDEPQPIYGVEYEINSDPVSYTAGSSTYDGKEYTEVELTPHLYQNNPDTLTMVGSKVENIIPTEGTTVVRLDYVRREKSDADYTVKHEYYNVVSNGEAQPMTEDDYSQNFTAKHGDKISVSDAMKDSTANGNRPSGYYEYVGNDGPIKLNKAETKNLTITYNHYQYTVTTQGDDGVATRSGDGIYDKNGTAQVKFTLNEGYQLKSVTDNDTPVKVDEENGVYTISGITEDHKVKIETEKIPCTLKVYYVFSDGQKPATGFKDYEETLDYGSKYTAKVVEAPAGYTLTYDKEEVSGTITGNTEVWFLYTPNGQASVNVFYKIKDGYYLLPRRSTSDLIGRTYDVSSWKLDSITTPGGKIYDLENKDEVMKGTYKLGGTNITLLYTERAKAPITIKYVSEDTTKAVLTKDDYKTEGYTKAVYDIRGNAYIPETLTDGTNTWYYSHNLPATDLTGILEGPVTVTAKYYLKPTYSVTATYTTVSNGSSSVQTDATGKLTGEIGDTPFDLNTYVVKYGFTSSDYQNDLAVNGNPASEMPAMEKFGDYVVTLSYKKTVNSGVETTIKHDFRTFLDGVEIADNTTADDNVFSHTWGETIDMSKYSKVGQAGYEGYTVEKYSTPDGKLTAGDKGTITYVRNLVSVVFDLNGGTWNKSLNNVEYNVAKGTGLNSQQPVPQPEKDKCKFAGWTAQPSNATINGTFDQRTVFTAKWEQDTVVATTYFYTVTYNYTVTTDGTVTYQDSETTEVRDTTTPSQTVTATATASHGGYTFDLASPAEQTADLTGTTREAPHQFVVNYVLTVNNNGGGGRDDRDDDRPAPKPTPDTEIKDDDVPKTDLPEQPVEIPDEDTPKTDLPQAPVDIPDEDTPKADVPKTGDAMGLWVMAAVASGAGLVWLNLTGKKRKDDNG